MWPMKLDYSKNESRAKLRNIELDAYALVMDALRAQGQLSEEKLRVLRDLRAVFHITEDRHKAEARRVANDERLATIADHIIGCETYRDWAKEGRRAVPLLPRGIPETAFIKVADNISQKMQEQNKMFPTPEKTKRDRTSIEGISFYEEKKPETHDIHLPLHPLGSDLQTINTSPTVELSGANRKRRIVNDNYALNQQLYPNVTKAQMAGKRAQKRPRKEKKQKPPPPPPLFPKVDYEESINQLQDSHSHLQSRPQTQQLQPQNNQGFNRIIHSYASSPVVLDNNIASLHQSARHQQEVSSVNHTNSKEPKVQILSNEPVRIIPALAIKNLQSKANIKLVQSPPSKVVLRPLSDTDTTKVTQLKGSSSSSSGIKLNVQGNVKSNVVIVNRSETVPLQTQLAHSKHIVRTVNCNGESSPSVKPTIIRNISAPIGLANASRNPSNVIKLDPSQIKCLRIVPVPTSMSSNIGGSDRMLLSQKSSLTKPIKLPKDSKLYPVNYNNGNFSSLVIEPKQLNSTKFLQTSLQQNTILATQEKSIIEKDGLCHSEERDSSHDIYDDIIEEIDSGDDTDKTRSQDEEQSDVEVSCEIDGSTAYFRKSSLQIEDKLGDLTKDLVGSKVVFPENV